MEFTLFSFIVLACLNMITMYAVLLAIAEINTPNSTKIKPKSYRFRKSTGTKDELLEPFNINDYNL